MSRLKWTRHNPGGPLFGMLGKHTICNIVKGGLNSYYLTFVNLRPLDYETTYSFREEDLQNKAEELVEEWIRDSGVLK